MAITTLSQLDMRAVRQTIATVLSLPSHLVLDANAMNDVTTLTSFVTVGVLLSEPLGSEYKFNGIDEQEIITKSSVTTISVNAYGINSYQLLEKLVSSLETSQAKQHFKRIKIAVINSSTVRNLPTVIAGGKEQRAHVDIQLSHIHRIASAVNRIETAEINLIKETNNELVYKSSH